MSGRTLSLLNRLYEDEAAQGMVEYLLILSLVVFTIMAMFAAVVHLFTGG